jgi:hypothetical protein
MFRESSAQHWSSKSGLFDKWSFDYYQKSIYPGKTSFHLKNESFSVDVKKLYPSYLFTTGTGCQPTLTKEQYDNQNWRNEIAFKILKEIDETGENPNYYFL